MEIRVTVIPYLRDMILLDVFININMKYIQMKLFLFVLADSRMTNDESRETFDSLPS